MLRLKYFPIFWSKYLDMDIVTVSCLRELDFHDNRPTCLKVSKLL